MSDGALFAKENLNRSGVGLSITHKILERHTDGQIAVPVTVTVAARDRASELISWLGSSSNVGTVLIEDLRRVGAKPDIKVESADHKRPTRNDVNPASV